MPNVKFAMIIALRILLCVVVACVLFGAYIYFRQESMIYYPRPYRADDHNMLPPRAQKLEYAISCGNQTAWYIPPRSAADDETTVPATLWMFFGGNGSLAMYWSNGVKVAPDPDAGFVLFDYPGYGHCEGKPSPQSIAEAGDAVLKALAAHLGTTTENLKARKLRLMGHSLGAAAALAFAERHPADRIVLAAPFTSLKAMADLAVSPWMSWMLRHHYDNMAALRNVLSHPAPPRVIITHGTVDPVIPVDMSRELAQSQPGQVELVIVKGADHESILDGIEDYMAPDLPPVPQQVSR